MRRLIGAIKRPALYTVATLALPLLTSGCSSMERNYAGDFQKTVDRLEPVGDLIIRGDGISRYEVNRAIRELERSAQRDKLETK